MSAPHPHLHSRPAGGGSGSEESSSPLDDELRLLVPRRAGLASPRPRWTATATAAEVTVADGSTAPPSQPNATAYSCCCPSARSHSASVRGGPGSRATLWCSSSVRRL